jgi:hypothetical protein
MSPASFPDLEKNRDAFCSCPKQDHGVGGFFDYLNIDIACIFVPGK